MKGNIFDGSPNGFDRKEVLEYVEGLDTELCELQKKVSELEAEAEKASALQAENEDLKASLEEAIKKAETFEKENLLLKENAKRLVFIRTEKKAEEPKPETSPAKVAPAKAAAPVKKESKSVFQNLLDGFFKRG